MVSAQLSSAKVPRLPVAWLDLAFCVLLVVVGFVFACDAPRWAGNVYVGNSQYGDAEFWWNGALHFARGIVAENPNLTYRMGYAVFGGLLAAVCGTEYATFHHILLALFLLAACWLYFSLRELAGRIAAAAAAALLVLNPYTAEWLAISTSDGLGLVLNLVALLALCEGVRRQLKPGWIALFGFFTACASLTRPLMMPFVGFAIVAVVAAGWGRWRLLAVSLGGLLVAFLVPTLAWMGLMGALTGNFAISGASQDSSAFYSASDPKIQVWTGEMYDAVSASAKNHFHTDKPSAQQLNAEFWRLTKENYREHWLFHAGRFWPHAFEIARFTPAISPAMSAGLGHWRTAAKSVLTIALLAVALRHRRWVSGALVAVLGGGWAFWPALHPWLVIAAVALGLAAVFRGNRPAFLWAAYWFTGVIVLYLVGGTWSPPDDSHRTLTGLGYRLGFQSFFASDVLVVFLLSWAGRLDFCLPEATVGHRFFRPSILAHRVVHGAWIAAVAGMFLLLGIGSSIVGWRICERAQTPPIPYPDLKTLGARYQWQTVINATSTNFIWNVPGQRRSVLLLYKQDLVQPLHMSPNRIDVQVSSHLAERDWAGRQGAWVLRNIPTPPSRGSQLDHLEFPAVSAFIPLAEDGKSYDTKHAAFFPIAKSAAQLAASGELSFRSLQPDWAFNRGAQQRLRSLALRRIDANTAQMGFDIDLRKARGARTLRFDIQLSRDPKIPSPPKAGPPPSLSVFATPSGDTKSLWQTTLRGRKRTVVSAEIAVPPSAEWLHMNCSDLSPSDMLWFNELTLTAEDFAP